MSVLSAPPSPTVSTVNLILTALSFLSTIPTLFPRSFPLPHPPFRLLHTLLLLSPVVPSLYTLSTLLADPFATLAPSSAPTLLTLLDAPAASRNLTAGLSRFVYRGGADVDTSPAPHVAIVAVCLVSAAVVCFRRNSVRRQAALLAFAAATAYILGSLLAAFQPGTLSRDSTLLRNTWLDEAFADIAAVNESRLLGNFWARENTSVPEDGEAESVEDMHVEMRGNVRELVEVTGFAHEFCDMFNRLPVQAGLVFDVVDEDGVPITTPPTTTAAAATTEREEPDTDEGEEQDQDPDEDDESDRPPRGSEDDRPQAGRQALPLTSHQSTTEPVITQNLLSQILVVYTVGKPLYTTYGKSLSLLSLPFLTLSPVFIGHATRSRVLYPFIVAWVSLLLLLIIIATPETLRWIAVPLESSGLMTFCGRRYQVFVVDGVTRRVAVFDIVSFALVGVTAFLQGFRWLRGKEEDDEVKMLQYDDVYGKDGSLKW